MDSKELRAAIERDLSRRKFLQVAGLGAVAAAVAACAPGVLSSASPAGSAGATAAGSAAASAAASSGASLATGLSGQTGVLWGLKYDPHIETYERLSKLFESQTGAKLKVVPVDWPIPPKLIASIAAGEQPDVVCGLGSNLTSLYLQKALMPLKKDVFEAGGIDVATAFIGDSIPAFTFRGDIYGVPVETGAVGMPVNVPIDDVKALGLEGKYPPTDGKAHFDSYESMWELAKALQKTAGGKVTRWGLSSQGWDFPGLLGIIRSQGVEWWDGDAKKFNFESDAGIKAFKLYVETPVKLGIETELATSGIDAALQGKVALVRGNGTPAIEGPALGYNYHVTGAPRVVAGEDPLFLGEGGWGFVAPRTAKNPDLSLAFLRMMATFDGQNEFGKIYGGSATPAWAELVTDLSRFKDPNPDSPAMRQYAVIGPMLKRSSFYGEEYGSTGDLQTAMTVLTSEIRQGKRTAESAATEMQVRAVAQYEAYLKQVAEFEFGG